MNERFTDLAFTKGDFNKATTSPSQTALTNWNWFLKYHLVNYLNFKPERLNISFQSGTFVHEYFQAFLQGRDFEDKDISAHYENKLNNMKLEERHLMKGKFIHKKINKQTFFSSTFTKSGSILTQYSIIKNCLKLRWRGVHKHLRNSLIYTPTNNKGTSMRT